jgi:hypothetical protein
MAQVPADALQSPKIFLTLGEMSLVPLLLRNGTCSDTSSAHVFELSRLSISSVNHSSPTPSHQGNRHNKITYPGSLTVRLLRRI